MHESVFVKRSMEKDANDMKATLESFVRHPGSKLWMVIFPESTYVSSLFVVLSSFPFIALPPKCTGLACKKEHCRRHSKIRAIQRFAGVGACLDSSRQGVVAHHRYTERKQIFECRLRWFCSSLVSNWSPILLRLLCSDHGIWSALQFKARTNLATFLLGSYHFDNQSNSSDFPLLFSPFSFALKIVCILPFQVIRSDWTFTWNVSQLKMFRQIAQNGVKYWTLPCVSLLSSFVSCFFCFQGSQGVSRERSPVVWLWENGQVWR
jgi:hypothetical protein